MEINLERYTYYIRPGFTDMRKGARSLAYVIQNEMKLNAFEPSVFIFCGGQRRVLKLLLWNGNGFLEVIKRIETHEMFHWPKNAEEARKVGLEDVLALMKGQNPWVTFKPVFPSYV